MTKTPAIDLLRGRVAQYPNEYVFRAYADARSGGNPTIPMYEVLREVDALLAERDALKAKAQPVRKLREYKGVTYADGNWRNSAGSWASVSQLIAWVANSSSQRLTDADHAAIYALREQPYETVREDRQVIRDELPPVLPADAVAAEGVRDA